MRKTDYEAIIGTRCEKCTIPVSYKKAFHENGTCSFCKDFKRKEFKGEKALIKDIDLQPGEKIGITVSGGKDSVYMWGRLVDILGADRVVAFTYYKDRISSEVALENVKKAQKILGSELVIKCDADAWKYFRNNLKILLEKPDAAAVRVLLCVGCRYGITENLYRIGEERGISKYISGASYLELAPFKEELLKGKSCCGNIDEGLENLICCYDKLDWGDNLELIRRDQKFKYKNNDTLGNNFSEGYRYKLFDFDDYFENIPAKTEKEVVRRFDWKKTDRSWHFDCRIEDFKDLFYFGLLGYTELDFKLSAMVRYELISREEAMEELCRQADSIRNSYQKMESMLKEFGMDDCIVFLRDFYKNAKYLKGGINDEGNKDSCA